MHHGEAKVIIREGVGPAGENVAVQVYPIQAQHPPQHTDQVVFEVGQGGVGLGAVPIQHHQRVGQVGIGAVIIRAAVNGVAAAHIGGARSLAQQGIGDLAIQVIEDGHGLGQRSRLDIGRHIDLAVVNKNHVAAVHILVELADPGSAQGGRGHRGPTGKRIRHEGIGLSLRQQCAEVALVGVVLHRASRPGQGRARRSGIEPAHARHLQRSAGMQAGGEQAKSCRQQQARDESSFVLAGLGCWLHGSVARRRRPAKSW